jgi:hypothetical protein
VRPLRWSNCVAFVPSIFARQKVRVNCVNKREVHFVLRGHYVKISTRKVRRLFQYWCGPMTPSRATDVFDSYRCCTYLKYVVVVPGTTYPHKVPTVYPLPGFVTSLAINEIRRMLRRLLINKTSSLSSERGRYESMGVVKQ